MNGSRVGGLGGSRRQLLQLNKGNARLNKGNAQLKDRDSLVQTKLLQKMQPPLVIFYQLTAAILDKGYQAALCKPLKILPLFSGAAENKWNSTNDVCFLTSPPPSVCFLIFT